MIWQVAGGVISHSYLNKWMIIYSFCKVFGGFWFWGFFLIFRSPFFRAERQQDIPIQTCYLFLWAFYLTCCSWPGNSSSSKKELMFQKSYIASKIKIWFLVGQSNRAPLSNPSVLQGDVVMKDLLSVFPGPYEKISQQEVMNMNIANVSPINIFVVVGFYYIFL